MAELTAVSVETTKGDASIAHEAILTMLDLGAAKIGAVVASADELLGLATMPVPRWPSERPAYVELAHAVKGILADAEQMAGVKASRGAWIALSGTGMKYQIRRAMVRIRSQDGLVRGDDFARAVRNASSQIREVVQCIPIVSYLDEIELLEDPIGRYGQCLGVSVLLAELEAGVQEDCLAMLAQSGLVARGFVAGSLAAACVLTAAEKEIGTVLIDLGATHSTFVIFARGGPRYMGSVRYGGLSVTKDLAVAFGLPLHKAEELKIASFGEQDGHLEGGTLFGKVITARLAEILELLRSEIELSGWGDRIPGGYVLTGGGALAKGLTAYTAGLLGKPVRLGLTGIASVHGMMAGPAYSVLTGLAALVREYGMDHNRGLAQKGGGWWKSKLPQRTSLQ